MTGFHVLMTVIIATGLVLTAFTAVEHITGCPKNQRSYLRFFRGTITSILIAQLGAMGFGLHREYPSVLFMFFTLLYLNSPLEYIRFYTFLNPQKAIPISLKVPLVPVLPLFLMELYIYSRPYRQKAAMIGNFFADPLHHPMIYVFAACLLVTVAYTVLQLGVEIAALRDSDRKGPLRFSVMMSVIALASIVVSCMYLFTLDPDYILLGASGICITTTVYFLFKNRFPDFFQLLAREIHLKRYRRSLLKGLDPGMIHEHLSRLMNDEKLYRDMDLRMNDVAKRLMIKPHQLSQALNEQVKTDFRNFVNRFRIDEARRLLVEEPDRSIITICFEVGFNSKTSFNITFKKATGMSPKEYREKFGK